MNQYASSITVFQKHHQRFTQATWIIRIFYLLLFMRCLVWIHNSWILWIEVESLVPIWPVTWIKPEWIRNAITGIDLVLILSTLAAALFPDKRFIRIIVFLSFFQFTAFTNSFGKINHGFHMWIVIVFILIFLPQGPFKQLQSSISKRHQLLLVIASLQTLMLLFYTFSGVLKLFAAAHQIYAGDVHLFHPYALSYQVAFRLAQTNTPTLLGPLIIQYPLLGWPLYTLTAYLEAAAILAAFRPALHRVWGPGLALMHFGIWLVMGIPFFENMVALILFFWYSPFALEPFSWRETIRELPLIKGFLYLKQKIQARKAIRKEAH